MSKILLSRAAVLVAVILGAVGTSVSQQTAPVQRIPQFENEDVNVWKTTVLPNAPLVMHTHEHPRVIVPLSSGTMKIVYRDGGAEVHQWEAGNAYWLSLEEGKRPHADANTGAQPIEVMVIEIKSAK